jgi:hypothetical protein
MFDIYDAAKRLKPPYHPTEFRRMVSDLGGKEAANRLLAAKNVSSGFAELYTRGPENLKLSVEYLVLQEPWRTLFRPEQLAVARRRLVEVGCELPPEDLAPEITEIPLGEELPTTKGLVEGAVRQVVVSAYERNPSARASCIAHYGAQCVVCGFDFGVVYGSIGQGYIHVHHLTPLSDIKTSHAVDPVADLRPVCANCHAVIHLNGGCRSIEEVQQLVRGAKFA